ncbi:flagellar FlbD family protein [Candidatus Acetothermia bacterium]|nr:flagellar FlbD family protein [Candidatus Acetothermia bacterium]
MTIQRPWLSFIELTDSEGRRFLLNVETISRVTAETEGTRLYFTDGHDARVRESYDRVKELFSEWIEVA